MNSTKIGYKLGFDSDPETFRVCIRLYAESYRLFGGILLIVGLINVFKNKAALFKERLYFY